MADTDDTIDQAAFAQPSVIDSQSAAKPPKRSLRRRVIAPDQTALSSTVPSLPALEPSAPSDRVAVTETPVAAQPEAAAAPAPAAPEAEVPAAVAKEPTPKVLAKLKSVTKPLPVTKPAKSVAAKPIPPQHVAAVAKVQPTKVAPAKSAASATHPLDSAAKPAVAPSRIAPPNRTDPDASHAVPASQPAFEFKDKIMDMTANFSTFQDAISDAQAKAQAAFEKSSTVFGEVGDFTKGNVEAVIASGKILAEGVQEIGSTIVAEGRTAFESMTGDMKELAAAKSPTDFLKLQSEMARKNFDSAVAYGSKNTETFLKLMNDAFAPISGRVSLAVEKARQAAPMNAAAV